tara:strand:+ start:41009 stop:41236 length:228 start_codon:yes stop_codon:yes gene_type:complete
MEVFNNNFFLAGLVSLLYFVVKYFINPSKEKRNKKKLFKDSILILVIVYIILILKDNYSSKISQPTTIFTGEPQF